MSDRTPGLDLVLAALQVNLTRALNEVIAAAPRPVRQRLDEEIAECRRVVIESTGLGGLDEILSEARALSIGAECLTLAVICSRRQGD